MFVSEIMSSCVTECTEDIKLEEVFELMKKCDHGLVVVIDSEVHRVPIGIVNERSICEQIIARGRNPRSLTAGSVMDSRIQTVNESSLVDEIVVRDDRAAIIVTNNDRQVRGLLSKDKLLSREKGNSKATTMVPSAPAPARHDRTPVVGRMPEIPVFGWLA